MVLRSGGIYLPKHAQILAAQIAKQAPFHEIVCLSDVEVPGVETIPLQTAEKGWWAKMELFRPDIKGDLLYFDLDTIVRGRIDELLNVGRLTLLRDFYRDGVYKGRPEGLGSGLMYLPEADRADAWRAWTANPKRTMGGDQMFLEGLWLQKAARWQDVVPGKVVSYKASRGEILDDVAVVVFHGRPRPWAAPEFQHLYKAA